MINSRPYYAILALALLLRIAWAIAVPVQPFSDPAGYDLLAQNLARGGGFGFQPGNPTAHWLPGAPFVYALFYFVFGHTYTPIVVMNLALGVFVVAAAMQLAERWIDRRVSLVTGLLLAIWPNLIEFTTLLASELLFCALLLAALIVWMHPTDNRLGRTAGAGILLGAACYVRDMGLPLAFLFVAFEWLRVRNLPPVQAFKGWLVSVTLLGIVAAVVIAPWSIRNTLTVGRFVLISTNGGEVFWNGNNVNSDGKSMEPTPQSTSTNAADQDAYLTALALFYLRDHPLDFGIGFLEKLVLLHSRESIGIVWNELALTARWNEGILFPLKAMNAAYWYVVLAFALGGLAILPKQNGWHALFTQPALWLWAFVAFTTALFLGQDRYHIPAIPAIAMLAAYALAWVYDRWEAHINTRAHTLGSHGRSVGTLPEMPESDGT